MQPQNFSAESPRENILKNIEAQELPPAQLAREMLRQGDERVTKLKSEIDDLISELEWEEGQENTISQLKIIQKELDSAHGGLRSDLRAAVGSPSPMENEATIEEINAGWEAESAEPETEIEKDIWIETLESLDRFFETGEITQNLGKNLETTDGEKALRQTISEKTFSEIIGDSTNFGTVKKLLRLAESGPTANRIIRSEFVDFIGSQAWEKLAHGEDYIQELENIQTSLSRNAGSKEQPLCHELGLDRLILLREMFGAKMPQMAQNVDLSTYCSELNLNDGEILVSPTLDKESGLLSGKVSILYEYGAGADAASMHRRFSSRVVKGEGGYGLERSTTLELITLPDKLKGKNTAKQEMAATNEFLRQQEFDKEKLHANIDIGGYTWATLGFGWDVEKMRRADEKEKSDLEIIAEFAADRINITKRFIRDSGINPDEPDIKIHLDTIENKLKDMTAGALITPQELAALGKSGPKFIRHKTGNLFRAETFKAMNARLESIAEALGDSDKESSREQLRSAAREIMDDPELIKLIDSTDEQALTESAEESSEALKRAIRKIGVPDQAVKGEMHLGKIIMIGSDWYGQKQL